jgi:hypothetical protein
VMESCRTIFGQSRRESVSINIETSCYWVATCQEVVPAKTHICAT